MYELLLKIVNYFNIPTIFLDIIWPVFPFIGVAALMIIVVLFLVLLERKLLALFTVRKGPNRVGPCGYFQTIADAIKLLCKEDIMPANSNKILFTVAPLIFFAPVMVIYGLVPFGENLVAIDIAAGVFAILAISSISSIGLVLAGWSSNNKFSLMGGLRSAAQAISYEIPLVISMLSVVVLSGSMNLQEIIKNQQGHYGLLNWFVFPSFLGFAIFFICIIAEINRVPFDLPEAESELVSGYNTEYTGMKFALFFLAEYAGLFIFSVLAVVLFLGGYTSPFGFYLSKILFSGNNLFLYIEQTCWLILKSYIVIFFVIWVRATLPRVRSDQLSAFSWKFLLPLSIINLFLVSIYSYLMQGS
jgi:NADH-quinone oxidoreductase subunit H